MKTTVQINIKPKLARALEKVPEAAIEKWLQDCFPNTLEADENDPLASYRKLKIKKAVGGDIDDTIRALRNKEPKW